MTVSVSTNVEINGINKLNEYIDRLKKYSKMQTNKDFQKFLQRKVMDTLIETMNERLTEDTTNSEFISLYWNSNYIVEATDGRGFILYNDAKIPANAIGVQNVPENYPDGMFSIALAFEYGVGIVGMNTEYDESKYLPWEYNKNNYNFGWFLPADVSNYYGLPAKQRYVGYEGFEIYRWTATKVENRLKDWVDEYIKTKGA